MNRGSKLDDEHLKRMEEFQQKQMTDNGVHATQTSDVSQQVLQDGWLDTDGNRAKIVYNDPKPASDSSQTKPVLENPKTAMARGKVPMSVVSAVVIAELGVAMLEGALKHGRHNYRAAPVLASDYFDGNCRHLFAWWEGEDIDPDTCELDAEGKPILSTGLSHVTKAIASLTVLRDAMIRGTWIDDRPPRMPAFYGDLNDKVKSLRVRYGHLTPRHYTINDDV